MSRSSKEHEPQVVPGKDAQKKQYAFHAHSYREVLSLLHAREEGLSDAEVEKRRAQHGTNTFTQARVPGLLTYVFRQLKSPLAFVLVIAFLLTVSLQEYLDATVIAIALSVAVFVGVLQEGKASRAFHKLASSQVRFATVLRAGKKMEIKASELVPGDIVVLQSGVQVPADLRIVRAKNLSVNEAPLTGEWLAVSKSTDAVSVGTILSEQSSMAWMGTFVSEGYGQGVVVATGDQTVMGTLAADMQSIEDEKTPLQHEMSHISHVMLYIITGLVLLIFAIGLVQGQSLHDMLLMSIAIAVASIPEGLPAAVAIILAVGMETLLKRGGLVRNLLAAETLGSTTFVLTDKTGTLTQARMKVSEVLVENGVHVTRKGFANNTLVHRLFDIALAATDAYTDRGDEEKHTVHGDPVEKAILMTAQTLGISEYQHSLRALRFDYLAFTSENRYAAGLSEEDGSSLLCINGAPGLLLARCSRLLTASGVRELTQEDSETILQSIENQTQYGKRLVGVAYRHVEYEDIPEHTDVLEDLVFVGAVVFDDPVRDDVADAIAGVQSAGAQLALLTGDNPKTALSIARQVGIAKDDDVVFTGADLDKLSDDEVYEALRHIRVFARVLPKQKLRIANLLQQRGEIVAMTGDGINDAPALRKANIGVAIGSGTEVAREASDLVLMNDSFAIIYAAIEEGRRIISNLKKIVGYLLSTSLSEVILIGCALIVGAPTPLLPVQILWGNMIEEGLMSVAFAFEKGEKNAMKRRPHDIHEEGILSKDMFWFVTLVVSVLGALLVAFYLYLHFFLRLPLEELRSILFLAISIDSLFISFAFRSFTAPFWRVPLRDNLFFIGAFCISALLLALVLTVPALQKLLSYQPLPAKDLWMVAAFGLSALLTVEFSKWLIFERRKD